MDVMLNQVAWAGWAGLLITGLNLIPAGQLDGGHALYVLFGEKRARQLLPVILVALVILGFFWNGWFLWAALIFFFGRVYAEPLDQITQLDTRRKILAAVVLVLFVLVITPIPLREIVGAALP
jgi:membrane-associated protease RseP (regulator of RpoE activity)